METKSMKIPEISYNSLGLIKTKIIARGKESLPDDFWEKECPFCHEALVANKKDYYSCPKCGFIKFIPGDPYGLSFLTRTALMTLAVYAMARMVVEAKE